MLTYSRNSWLGFAVAISVIAVIALTRPAFRRERGGLWGLLIGTTFVAACIAMPFSSAIQTRLMGYDQGSFSYRGTMDLSALQIARHSPWLGVGLGNYAAAVRQYEASPFLQPNGIPAEVHNMYLLAAAELGIPAAFVFIWVLTAFVGGGIGAIGCDNVAIRFFGLALFAGLCGAYVEGLFDPGGLGQMMFVNLAFRGGLLLGAYSLVARARSLPDVAPRWGRRFSVFGHESVAVVEGVVEHRHWAQGYGMT